MRILNIIEVSYGSYTFDMQFVILKFLSINSDV